jgi:hypothetical protein
METKEPQRERSLSPMELDSPISSPPPSPIILSAKDSQLNHTQVLSPKSQRPPTQDARSLHSSSDRALESIPLTSLPTARPLVDDHSMTNHAIALPSLVPMGHSVAENPEKSNGLTAPAQVPISRLLSAPDHPSKATALPESKPDTTASTKAGLASTAMPSGTGSKPHSGQPSARRGKTLVANPFVSGGYVTEFVGVSKGQNHVPKGVKEWFSTETTDDVKVSARLVVLVPDA